MPSIWDKGVYGLVYDGRSVDLTSRVNYMTADTLVIVFRKSGGVLKSYEVLKQHGFTRLEDWPAATVPEKETRARLRELAALGEDAVIFFETPRLMKAWKAEVEALGLRSQLLPLVTAFFETLLPRYREVYDLLEDDASRAAFTVHLSSRYHLMANHELASVYAGDQYFAVPEMLTFSAGEVFVDCGAFVGDTVESYLNHCQGIFHKAIAFEPGPVQFAAMQTRFRRLTEEWALPQDRLVAVQAGVSDTPSHAAVTGGAMSDNLIGTRLVANDDADGVAIVTLDEALQDQRVDFLKADIEGYEMAMLRGARELIRTQKPRMAICLYHKLTDPYEIPLYLKELVPEYHFQVRQHAMNFTECVLYAYCV